MQVEENQGSFQMPACSSLQSKKRSCDMAKSLTNGRQAMSCSALGSWSCSRPPCQRGRGGWGWEGGGRRRGFGRFPSVLVTCRFARLSTRNSFAGHCNCPAGCLLFEVLLSLYVSQANIGSSQMIIDWVCRMEQHEQLATSRRYAEKQKGEHPLDPATGQPLFQPITGRPPAAQRNQAHMPVGDYLYGLKCVQCTYGRLPPLHTC